MSSRAWLGSFAFILTSIGCGFSGGGGDVQPEPDAGPDPEPDAPMLGEPPCNVFRDAALCLHLMEAATAPLVLASTTIDTMTDPRCAKPPYVRVSARYCILVGSTISVPAGVTVRGIGSRPLVLASPGDITIDGTIDVSSYRAQGATPASPGAGASFVGCQAFRRMPEARQQGGGGGAGASFQGRGGNGGTGNSGGTMPADSGLTEATPDVLPLTIHGGCRGQDGGGSGGLPQGGPAGVGGAGGGALIVASKGRLSLGAMAQLFANGAGGGGGGAQAGGGGGGSGGYIQLDATTYMRSNMSKLSANGGGGGEGGHYVSLDDSRVAGAGGEDGIWMRAANGGSGANAAADGKEGSYGSDLGGETGDTGGTTLAGGGGGGAAGFLQVIGQSFPSSGIATPTITLTPRS